MPGVNCKHNRREFWFVAQGGCCHLQITDGCRAVGGVMDLDTFTAKRSASWDHLDPRNGAANSISHRNDLLLACCECNVKRGRSPLRDDAAARDLAKRIREAWRAATAALAPVTAAKRRARLAYAEQIAAASDQRRAA